MDVAGVMTGDRVAQIAAHVEELQGARVVLQDTVSVVVEATQLVTAKRESRVGKLPRSAEWPVPRLALHAPVLTDLTEERAGVAVELRTSHLGQLDSIAGVRGNPPTLVVGQGEEEAALVFVRRAVWLDQRNDIDEPLFRERKVRQSQTAARVTGFAASREVLLCEISVGLHVPG